MDTEMKRPATLLILWCLVSLATGNNAHPFFRSETYPAWSQMTPEQLLIDSGAAIVETQKNHAELARLTAEKSTFGNTFLAYARLSENLRQVQGYMMHLMNVASTPELMTAQSEAMAEAAKNGAETQTDHLARLLTQAASAPWVQELSAEKKRFVQTTLQRLRRSGAYLTPEQRARKAEIEMEMRQLSLEFHKSLAESYKNWELVVTDPAELAGMPERWMDNAAKEARAKGYATDEKPAWLINLTSSHASAVVSLCTVEETRRKCWLGTSGTGTAHTLDNEPILYRTMELRHELAQMLGYRNYADMQAEERMAGSGENALAFVDSLLAALKPLNDAENAEYLARLSKAKGETITRLNPWDEAFYARQAPAPARQQFDAGLITPYLEAERVLKGLTGIWEKLLGIRITELPTVCLKPGESCPEGHVEVWHPDVRCYSVHDTTSGRHLGSYYLDLYPRAGKRGDGWTTPIRFGRPGEAHLAAIVANLTPPGKPHLFNHGDLYVLFHEFGHLMHMLLGHPELMEHNAMSIERDFVEMPSQLQELWIWEPEALATFAVHYETGAPLPAELAQQLAASRKQAPVSNTMRMLRHAKLDLEMNLYFHEKFRGRPLDEAAAELLAPWQLPYTAPTPSDMRTVHHTMNPGYAAGFYIYLWSESLSVDAFTRFQREGVMNPATGAAYRKCILAPGGSRPALELFRDFMGRDPDPKALLRKHEIQESL